MERVELGDGDGAVGEAPQTGRPPVLASGVEKNIVEGVVAAMVWVEVVHRLRGDE